MDFEAIPLQKSKNSQSLKIPKRLWIDDRKVFVKKIGNALYIIPFNDPWASLFEGVDAFTEDFMQERGESIDQKRDSLD
jgi:antitoxin VapB